MSYFSSFDTLCRRIVCPTRHRINESDMIYRKFKTKKINFDFVKVQSHEGYMLSVVVFQKNFETLPTVFYLHGNGGNKLECLQLAHYPINLIAFDFGGCGKSEGEFVTYGEKQAKDIASVVKYMKANYGIGDKKISLWGRSMGASLALLYASSQPQQIQSIILDSPFRTLQKVIENVALKNNYIPYFIFNIGFGFLKDRIFDICSVNIFQYDFLDHLNLLNDIPILFAHSSQDYVVKSEDVRELYQLYQGPKYLYAFQCHHHEDRPQDLLQFGYEFIMKAVYTSVYEHTNRGLTFSEVSRKKGISLSTRRQFKS